MTTIDRLRWRIRVWAWRLGLPILVVSALGGCAHRQRVQLADTIARRCVAAISAAPDEARARAIAAECHRQIEGLR